jgi:pimeloyl-ACP methyl ester carboxylesterase
LASSPVRRLAGCIAALAPLACFVPGCSGPIARNDGHRVYREADFGQDRFAVVRGFNVHYVDAGDGDPIVLIPGAFSTYRVWNRVLPALAERHRVIAIDYVGTGDSDKPEEGFDYSVGAQADVVAELIRVLELRRPLLVGVSYGGAIALNVAARYPGLPAKVACVEGGVLIAPDVLNYSHFDVAFGIPVVGELILLIARTGIIDRAISKTIMGDAWDALTPEERGQIMAIHASYMMTATSPAMYGVYRSITGYIDFTAEMKDELAPVLYLCGERSKYRDVADANVAFFTERRCNVAVVRLKDGIHDLQLQYPQAIARIVLDYFHAAPDSPRFAGGTVAELSGDDATAIVPERAVAGSGVATGVGAHVAR